MNTDKRKANTKSSEKRIRVESIKYPSCNYNQEQIFPPGCFLARGDGEGFMKDCI